MSELDNLRRAYAVDTELLETLRGERDAAVARAETAEEYVAKLLIDVSGLKGTIGQQHDRICQEALRAEKAEASITTLRSALSDLLQVVNMLMPGVRYIALQNYALLNEAPIKAQELLDAKDPGAALLTERDTLRGKLAELRTDIVLWTQRAEDQAWRAAEVPQLRAEIEQQQVRLSELAAIADAGTKAAMNAHSMVDRALAQQREEVVEIIRAESTARANGLIADVLGEVINAVENMS